MHTKRQAITLVEVLISIIVIGIGIIAILASVIYSLSLLDRVKAETIGTSLAKEGLELVFSLRDTNLRRGINWDCIKLDSNFNCILKFSDLYNHFLQISLNRSGGNVSDLYTGNSIYFLEIVNNSGFQVNRLYLKTGSMYGFNLGWYNYLTGKKTFFARYIYFTGLYLAGDLAIGDTNKVLKVNSVVIWKKGFIEKKFILESVIGDIY